MNRDRKLKKLSLDEIVDAHVLSKNLSEKESAEILREFGEEKKQFLIYRTKREYFQQFFS